MPACQTQTPGLSLRQRRKCEKQTYTGQGEGPVVLGSAEQATKPADTEPEP